LPKEIAKDVPVNGPGQVACFNVMFTFNAPDLVTTNVCDTSLPNDATVPENVSVVTPEVLLGLEELLHPTIAVATADTATARRSSFQIPYDIQS
jgi:hypothetical protein